MCIRDRPETVHMVFLRPKAHRIHDIFAVHPPLTGCVVAAGRAVRPAPVLILPVKIIRDCLLETAVRIIRMVKHPVSYTHLEEEQTDSLSEYFNCLEPLTPLSSEIRRCILSEDEMADDASPALKKIRRSMTLTGEKIHNQLAGMVNGPARSYLQDAVITSRDGRYCIPVKAEYKSQVPGMVHAQSSTGSTFCIEPAAVVSLSLIHISPV